MDKTEEETKDAEFEPFNKVISFGSMCLSAMALQHGNLRSFATPLDWIFSSPEMISHCISDNWQTFLDPTQLIDYGSKEHEIFVGHSLYSRMLKKGKTNCKIFLPTEKVPAEEPGLLEFIVSVY